MKQKLLAAAAALLCASAAYAYDAQDFLRQYKDTISIVETNYTHNLPISGYERGQLFQKEFLMRAAEFGPQELLEKALSLATSPLQILQTDKLGRTALFYAANAEFADALINRLLTLEARRGLKIGYAAMNEGPVAPARKAKRFLDKRDDDGATALMVLLRDGKADAALRVLRRGADACAKDTDGVTALHMAVIGAKGGHSAGLIALRKVLASCPQNVLARDRDGRTPLDWADREDSRTAYEALRPAYDKHLQAWRESWKNRGMAL